MYITIDLEVFKDERLYISDILVLSYYRSMGEVLPIKKTCEALRLKHATVAKSRGKLKRLGLLE